MVRYRGGVSCVWILSVKISADEKWEHKAIKNIWLPFMVLSGEQNSVFLLKSPEADFSLWNQDVSFLILFQSSFLLGFHALKIIQFMLWCLSSQTPLSTKSQLPANQKSKLLLNWLVHNNQISFRKAQALEIRETLLTFTFPTKIVLLDNRKTVFILKYAYVYIKSFCKDIQSWADEILTREYCQVIIK